MTKEKPHFEHDCKDCIFLGRFSLESKHLYWSFEDDDWYRKVVHFDLYFCAKISHKDWLGRRTTVIARYGDCSTTPGGGYLSGLNKADDEPALFEARKRAIELGHLSR